MKNYKIKRYSLLVNYLNWLACAIAAAREGANIVADLKSRYIDKQCKKLK
jgi:hypothetical protein